jgi:polysaccharide pyruvyl transferase WcaK-like protein
MKLLFLADVSGGASHVGDEAMLEANVSRFRCLLPGCTMEVAAGPGWNGSRIGVTTVPRLEFSRTSEADRDTLLERLTSGDDPGHLAGRAALSCDALIISGGGNLSKSWPHFIYERLAMARLAALKGAPVILLGQTLGPDFGMRERDLVSELLRLSIWTGLRETCSYSLALELGADPETLSSQLDDAVFLEPEGVPADILEKPGGHESRPFIAVTIHPIGEATVRNPMVARLASSLRAIADATAANLVFVPHAAFEERVDGPGDRAFGDAIGRALYGNPPMHVYPVLKAPQTLGLTQEASLVISTRYHPLVFALAGGVPAIGLWSDEYTRWKLEGALIHAGRLADALPLEDALDGALTVKAIELWRSRAKLKEELQARVGTWREAEEVRTEKLKNRLLPLLSGKRGERAPLLS